MDEHSWHEWWRFAVEDGGIGTCIAALTRVTNENANRLAFRQGEPITVLFCVLPPQDTVYPSGLFLGFCGYSIGIFDGKEVHTMTPLRSAGTVDAALPAAQRPFAPVVKLTSIHVPPGRRIVRFEERTWLPPTPPQAEKPLAADPPSAGESRPAEFSDEGAMAISAAMLSQHPLDMSYVTRQSYTDTQPHQEPATLEPEASADSKSPLPDEESLWDDMRTRDPTYSIYDSYFRPSTYLYEDEEDEEDEAPVQNTPAPANNPPSSADMEAPSERDNAQATPSRQALLHALSSDNDDSMMQPRPMDTLMQDMPRTKNRLLDQADDTSASMTRSSSVRSDEPSTRSADVRFPLPGTPVSASPSRQKTPYRPMGTPAGRGSPWSVGSTTAVPRGPGASPASSPLRLASPAPTADTTLVGRPMSPFSSPRLQMGSGHSTPTMSPKRDPRPPQEPLSHPAPSLFGSPQRRAFVDMSEHALPERAQLFQQWSTVLTERTSSSRTYKHAVQLVHAGVPGALRGRVWLYLVEKKMRMKPEAYENVARASQDSLAYPDKYPFAQLIEQDLDQCFPLSQPFTGLAGSTRDDIRRMLHMYAFYYPDVGYTEGMCLVVGVLLTHLQIENAFWLLDTLVREYGLSDMYSGNMHRLQVDNFVVDELVRLVDAPLHQRLKELRIEPIMFLPGWVLPLFVRTLPWAALLRVWDMFLCYGHPFLLRTAVAVVCLSRQAVMGAQLPDRSLALRQLVFVHPAPLTVDGVLSRALELPVTDKELARMQASAERLVGSTTRPSYAIERNDPRRERLQGKPVTKKTLRVLMGRPKTS
ncbi:Similar to S.cerevisiae protein GYP5 (GTPase-activating protein (GAP) for yeast Rab family members) [Malassezia sympodialis ATCC 42132]|uniref:Similar to S.cerevisiae protein GYP5 (GTPase-activating protein (GAP) for yeast Rab family members) n=1 Tax=Malassezia sympodialis (strain ATCC 42132) TaxID=1230383 RepID=A0A1M8A2G1_MALS4|nr:Similar to S.cerevisiae protein GYP5 (GTPase-activating protein (GAP) for yeast Rab family members) [Malassezia sympodialis ATCC 42132]